MKENKKAGVNLIEIFAILVLVVIGMLILISKNSIIDFSKFVNQNNKQLQAGDTVNGANGQVATVADDEATKNWNLNRVNIVYDTEGVPVPVPKGYVASGVEGEHTVNNGFVIYEGEEEVTGVSTDSSVFEAQKTRNQWVWVPIYDPSEIYGVDENGMMHGKLYEFNENGRSALNWEEIDGIMNILDTSKTSEPQLSYHDADHLIIYGLIEENRNDFYNKISKEFKNTIDSIKKYGGFYVGRYETGDLSGEAKVVRGNIDIDNQNWYTNYEKCLELKGINSNVISGMIWGCQWDAILEWLVDSGDKSYSLVGSQSSSWGNCIGEQKKVTGFNEKWKANNIYDFCGNVYDMTFEFRDNYRHGRGASCKYGIYATAASRNGHDPDRIYSNAGSRAILYIML